MKRDMPADLNKRQKAEFLKTAIALFCYLANLCNRISMRLCFLFLAGINQTGEEFSFIKVLKRRNCLIDFNTFDCGEQKIGWISLSSCCLTRNVREVLDNHVFPFLKIRESDNVFDYCIPVHRCRKSASSSEAQRFNNS